MISNQNKHNKNPTTGIDILPDILWSGLSVKTCPIFVTDIAVTDIAFDISMGILYFLYRCKLDRAINIRKAQQSSGG